MRVTYILCDFKMLNLEKKQCQLNLNILMSPDKSIFFPIEVYVITVVNTLKIYSNWFKNKKLFISTNLN